MSDAGITLIIALQFIILSQVLYGKTDSGFGWLGATFSLLATLQVVAGFLNSWMEWRIQQIRKKGQ